MPRIRQNADIYQNNDFRKEVLGRLKYLGLQQHDLAEHLGVCDGTISIMLKNPQRIPMERLRKIIKFIGMEPAAVLRFAGYSAKEIKKELQV